jgi:protein translocase SecG subunit
MDLSRILSISQIIISALLIVSILLQQRGAGGSAITGGSGGAYYAKRGMEKVLFYATIVLAVIFIASAIASIIVAK